MRGVKGSRVKAWWFSIVVAAAIMIAGFTAPALAATDAMVKLMADFTSVGSGSSETNIGDLVADSLQNATGAQVALVNAQSLQTLQQPRGPVKASRLLAALTQPEEPVVKLTIPGDVLARALERGASNLPLSSPGFLSVSGLTYSLNPGAPSGKRVSSIRIGGKPLEPGASYTVAMPRSLAQGADGYFLVWPAGANAQPAGKTVGGALLEYLAGHEAVTPAERRIQGLAG